MINIKKLSESFTNSVTTLNKIFVKWAIAFDNFFYGHKIFFSMLVILLALHVMPESKAQYVVATASVVFGMLARKAKSISDKQ